MPFQHYGDQKHLPITPGLREYALECSSGVDSVLESLYMATSRIENRKLRHVMSNPAVMMAPAEQTALFTIIARLMSARTVLDIGTFTGASALGFARGMDNGTVHTFDITEEALDIARKHWALAGVESRVQFHLGDASEHLRAWPADDLVDIGFIDADKENYLNYYELMVPLIRPGGLLMIDNTLFAGYVLDPNLIKDPVGRGYIETIRAVNARAATDPRLETVLLPFADGLTISYRTDVDGGSS